MKRAERSDRRLGFGGQAAALVAGLALCAMPALAQEQSAPDPSESLTGTIFRWLNFAIIFFGIVFLLRKAAPFFRQNAKSITKSIHEAAEERAAAERELNEIAQKLEKIDAEVAELRRAAQAETISQAERIKELLQTELERIAQAARAEISAAERAAAQELRAATAARATEYAAGLVHAEMTPNTEASLFRSFIDEVERSAS